MDENRNAYRMITRYVVAGNDAEDLCRIAERLLIARIKERGIAGVKTRRDCANFRFGRDATSFDREIG